MLISRRHLLAMAGAALAAPVRAAGPAAPLAAPGPRSGLPWHSGVCWYGDVDAFEAWRGRPIDLTTVWGPRDTWSDLAGGEDDERPTGWFGGAFKTRLDGGFGIVCSWPLIADESHSIRRDKLIWTKTAKGEFTPYYERFARKLGRLVEKHNISPIVVRIAWEANGRKYPHSITEPYIAEWKTTFARAADLLRTHVPGVVLDWSSIKKGKLEVGNDQLYPGDDYVDVVGVDYYDAWPASRSEKAWERNFEATRLGGPVGLGSWLAFARSRSRRLSLPEYSIRADLGKGGGGDNPIYIERIFQFINQNSADLAYENYFNMGEDGQKIFPAHLNPAAAARYKTLWEEEA